MQTFSSKDFIMIYQYIIGMGYEVGKCTHIGDNVFEIEYFDEAPLAGRGYLGTFAYKEEKIIRINKKLLWMS